MTKQQCCVDSSVHIELCFSLCTNTGIVAERKMEDSIDTEDPTSNWVIKSSILLTESDPVEFTTGGKSTKETTKVKWCKDISPHF